MVGWILALAGLAVGMALVGSAIGWWNLARWILAIILVLYLLVRLSCAAYFRDATEEMLRVTSADGQLDAVVIRFNPGAMSDFYWRVYLVPAGKKATSRPLFHAKHANWVKVRWNKDDSMEVLYEPHDGFIVFFRPKNSWTVKQLFRPARVVPVKFIPPLP